MVIGVPRLKRFSLRFRSRMRMRMEAFFGFVPLGRLVEGHYRATLRFDIPTRADAQIISESFEIADHPDLRAEHGTAELRFGVDAQALQYLPLRTDGPAVLVELKIARESDPISRP